MTATYEKIATTTVSGSSVASIDFTSISGSYTDLIVIGSIKAASATNPQPFVRFNNDSSTNYSVTNMYGNGTTAGSTRFSSQAQIRLNYVVDPNTTEYTNLIMNIQNYSNTTTYKTVLNKLTLGGGSNSGLDVSAGLWRSTSAINRLTFTLENSSSNFAVGCVFTIYGIKAE
jgi:hypothetical protein